MPALNPNGYAAPVWNGSRWVGGWEAGQTPQAPTGNGDFTGMVSGAPTGNGDAIFDEGTLGAGGQWTPNAGYQGIYSGTNNPSGPAGGTPGAAGGTPGAGQITTSITPKPVYTSSQTATARNMAVNDAMKRTSPISGYKKFDRPGASRSLATQSLVMPKIASAYVDAAKAKAGIPLADMIANEQNLFQGQMARANEFMGLGRLQLGEQSLNNYTVQQLLQSLAPILGSLF